MPTGARAHEARRLPALRAAADVPQPALLHLLARLPARSLLPDRGPESRTSTTSPDSGLSAPLYYMVGPRRASARWARCCPPAPDRGRALGRLEPAAPADAALRPGTYFRAKILTAYLVAFVDLRPAVRRGHRARRAPLGGRVARHDRPDARRAHPVRARSGSLFGHLLTSGLDRPGDGRRRPPSSRSSAGRGSRSQAMA